MKQLTQIILAVIFLLNIAYAQEKKKGEIEEISPATYSEKFRPQYHFTPPSQWMNDPNGMVYLDGEYHLFYQHNPDSNIWGPMHWGHAISKNLVHWEHLPIALYPDSLGYIFSGSAVIDKNNTSGLGTNRNGPMVAIFTYHHDQLGETQGIAYSNDNGRTWTKYNNNPVLQNPGIPDFRDPKVSWYDQGNGKGKWIMTLAAKDKVSFYSSPNLINWTHESDFNPDWAAYGGVWECPDLFPLKTQKGKEKWVLLVSIYPGGPNGGSATQYFTGQFDGSHFEAEGSKVKWLDYGSDNYAGVTWSNIPEDDGRRLFLGWMSNPLYANEVPTTVWRSAMTLPRKLELFEVEGKNLLASSPVKEIESLRKRSEPLSEPKTQLDDNLFELELTKSMGQNASITFGNEMGDQISLHIKEEQIVFDRTKSGQVDFHKKFARVHHAPLNGIKIKKVRVFVDQSSLEFYFNEGELVITEIIFPDQPLQNLSLEGFEEGGSIHYLKSIWN